MKKLCVVAILWCSVFEIFPQSSPLNQSPEIDPSQIEIVRDAYGVPHIFAETDAEVAYGLAWAHAEDDFATIQLVVLMGKAKLGTALGRKGAEADYVIQML